MAGKKGRSKGEGTIYKNEKKGLFVGQAVVEIGGRKVRKTVYDREEREVVKKLRALQKEADDGILCDIPKMTVAQYLRHHLEARPLRKSTYTAHEVIIRCHIIPVIGKIPLAKLTHLHVETVYATMRKNGKSPRLQEYAHIPLNCALSDAVDKCMLPFNVMKRVNKPKAERTEINPMGKEQVIKFLKAAEADRLFALYYLAVATGMRQGELLALTWKDINFATGRIKVTKTLSSCGAELKVGPTKTKTSMRSVSLPEEARKVLLSHRQAMLAEGNISGPVFCDTKGGPLRANNLLSRSYKPLLKKAGLPDFRFHDLRHTTATLLMENGINAKVVQEMLGHSTIGTTLTYYGHVTPTMQEHAAHQMNDLLTNRTQEDEHEQDRIDSQGA